MKNKATLLITCQYEPLNSRFAVLTEWVTNWVHGLNIILSYNKTTLKNSSIADSLLRFGNDMFQGL